MLALMRRRRGIGLAATMRHGFGSRPMAEAYTGNSTQSAKAKRLKLASTLEHRGSTIMATPSIHVSIGNRSRRENAA